MQLLPSPTSCRAMLRSSPSPSPASTSFCVGAKRLDNPAIRDQRLINNNDENLLILTGWECAVRRGIATNSSVQEWVTGTQLQASRRPRYSSARKGKSRPSVKLLFHKHQLRQGDQR
ncbi:hypothetical protein E2C01_007889 [Portunus trituberculatus]|uniref:Uncharacterized protein n=1 Tax=Portunus trituberculatus TaxID=210409 RepID=A0A5B7D3K4_PORTR|nr:hypothetical protein [Portunus trituberculatus]